MSEDSGERINPHMSNEDAVARLVHMPHYRNAAAGGSFGSSSAGMPSDSVASTRIVTEQCAKTRAGNMGLPSDILTAQAMTLDAVFTEMLKRSGANIGEYPEAAERYMRMAMKAQAQCRTSIEALSKMHQPREQVVRHVHVYEGGQAVVAEQLHMHGPGMRNDGRTEQPHEPCATAPSSPALSSPNPFGNGVPVPSNAERALSHTWREVDGGAEG